MKLSEEIIDFLKQCRCNCSVLRVGAIDFIDIQYNEKGQLKQLYLLPVPVEARTVAAAKAAGEERLRAVEQLYPSDYKLITIVEDRWRSRGELFRKKLAAHCGIFRSVFARNCEARKISRPEAEAFLETWHSYGSASCRYCYGLFEKKSGALVAVATFSNARRWKKPEGVVSSYEWVRYSSPADVRVVGGMGKLLKKFVEDVSPDDIMSYADLEWSAGEAYRKLGFVEDGWKSAVLFEVDPTTWSRKALTDSVLSTLENEKSPGGEAVDKFYYKNFGSIKYRLKIYR